MSTATTVIETKNNTPARRRTKKWQPDQSHFKIQIESEFEFEFEFLLNNNSLSIIIAINGRVVAWSMKSLSRKLNNNQTNNDKQLQILNYQIYVLYPSQYYEVIIILS